MGRLVEAISFCVFLLILNAPAFSQDDFLDAVIPAPNGRPALVKGMDGIWETPVEVYSDADLEMFIPKGAIVANVYYELAKFVETGNYYVAVYSYYKNERACRHWMAVGGADPKSANSCAELGYKQRILAVDMQRKMVKIPSVQFIDKRGKVDFVAKHKFPPRHHTTSVG